MKKAGDNLDEMKEAHAKVSGVVKSATRPPTDSGSLASSVRPGATKTSAVIRAGGSRVPYAGVQEWGWPGHNIPAQPYLTTAAQQTEPVWTGIYQAEVQKILDRIRGA